MKRAVLAILLFLNGAALAQNNTAAGSIRMENRNAMEVSPLVAVFGKIYAVSYGRQLTESGQALIGFAYQNIEYDFGTTHAPTIVIGYKRYFWKNLYAEYSLWPAYNAFHEDKEDKYYTGFELWNEFRAGWDIDFKLGGIPVFISPQGLIGFGLIEGSKPQSFKDYCKDEEPVFAAFNVMLGFRF